jgi:alpha-galactosidase
VDDSTENTRELVRFYVYGDGKLLAESAPAKFGSKVQPLTADVRGVKVIELVVRDAKTGNAVPVVATWGDVQLTQAAAAGAGPRASGSDRI